MIPTDRRINKFGVIANSDIGCTTGQQSGHEPFLPYTLTSLSCVPNFGVIDNIAVDLADRKINRPLSGELVEVLGCRGINSHEIHSAFERLCIPVPGPRSFLRTSDQGALLFIHRFGVAIRLTCPAFTQYIPILDRFATHDIVKHPCVLQPILAFTLGSLHVEVLPGIRLSWDNTTVSKLVKLLKEEAVDFFDPRMENIGYIGQPNSSFPHGIPIVLDRNAVQNTKEPAHQAEFNQDSKCEHILLAHLAQEEIRTRLAPSVSEWLSEQAANPGNYSAAHQLWSACQEAKRDGLLVAGWMDQCFRNVLSYNSHAITSAAQNYSELYERRLSKLCDFN